MEPRIDENAAVVGPLPAEYDDDRGFLAGIHRVIDDDRAIGISKKRCQAKRRAWELLWPSFEQADAITLDSLRQVAAQGRLIDCLSTNAKDLGGASSTVNERLNVLMWGLKAAGLEEEHTHRIKSQLKRIRRATGYDAHKPQAYTWEDWQRLAKALDDICKSPTEYSYKKNRWLSDNTAQMGRAAVYLGASAALRISELCDIKISEVNENTLTYRVIKHRGFPEPKTVPMMPLAWEMIQSYLEVRKGDSEYLFPSRQQVGSYYKPAFEKAGIEPVNGRYGIHRFRHLLASDSVEYTDATGRQAVLDHSSTEAQKHYMTSESMNALAGEVLETWHEGLGDKLAERIEWDGSLGRHYANAMVLGEAPVIPAENQGIGLVMIDGQRMELGKVLAYVPEKKSVMLELGDSFAVVEMKDWKPVQLIVMTASGFRCSRRDLNPSRRLEWFEGYRAALADMGATSCK